MCTEEVLTEEAKVELIGNTQTVDSDIKYLTTKLSSAILYFHFILFKRTFFFFQ